MRHLITLFSLAIVLFAIGCQFGSKEDVSLNFPQNSPQAHFASDAILNSLIEKGLSIALQKSFNIDESKHAILLLTLDDKFSIDEYGFITPTRLKEEGFSVQVNENKIGVIGYDDAGMMYGGLELAEQISLYGIDGIKPVEKNPYMERRGTKFNIPNKTEKLILGILVLEL